MGIDVAEALQRHRAFWQRDNTDRPLTSVRRYSPLASKRLPLADGTLAEQDLRLSPDMLDPRVLVNLEGGRTGTSRRLLVGDSFTTRAPYNAVPWAEAILGCPVYADQISGVMWSEPILHDLRDLSSLVPQPDNAWYQKLLEYIRALVEDNDGSYLVADARLRGPIDIAAAMLGPTEMCLAIYDSPDALRSLLDVTADLFLQAARAQQELIPRFHGGCCSAFGIWAPGTVARSQCDHAALLSPQTFEELVLPFEQKILRPFDYSIIHLHSTYLHTVDALLEAEHPAALEIWLDTSTRATPRDLVPTCKKILERKPLLIEGRMTIADLEYLIENLPPHGLYLRPGFTEEELARLR